MIVKELVNSGHHTLLMYIMHTFDILCNIILCLLSLVASIVFFLKIRILVLHFEVLLEDRKLGTRQLIKI
jgi:hypothetical protein